MNLYEKVENIINEWDPIDLLPLFPQDEYKIEILEIVQLLKKTSDIGEITKGIKRTFTNAFGDDVFTKSDEECLVIAKRLLNIK